MNNKVKPTGGLGFCDDDDLLDIIEKDDPAKNNKDTGNKYYPQFQQKQKDD